MVEMVAGEGRAGAGVADKAGCVRQGSGRLLSFGYVMIGLMCVTAES